MILVFAKTPVKGTVKTRLIPSLGEDAATRLYLQLLHRTLNTACGNTRMSVQLRLLGDLGHPEIDKVLNTYKITVQPQQGENLGERMHLAAENILATEAMVILIGTDCPVLTESYLYQAMDALLAGNDVVLGPAEDGGYVLLGMRKTHTAIFTDIVWGSSQVLTQTREKLNELGWRYQLLPILWDVDRPEDVRRFQSECSTSG